MKPVGEGHVCTALPESAGDGLSTLGGPATGAVGSNRTVKIKLEVVVPCEGAVYLESCTPMGSVEVKPMNLVGAPGATEICCWSAGLP